MKNEKNCCIIPLFSNTPLLASKHFFSRKRAKLSHRGYYALYEYSTWGVNCQLFLHILSTFSVFSPVLYENFFYFPPFLLVFPITVAVTASVFYLQNNFSYPLLFSLYSAFLKKILFCRAKFLLDSKIFFYLPKSKKLSPKKGAPLRTCDKAGTPTFFLLMVGRKIINQTNALLFFVGINGII